MKRILIALALCLIASTAFATDWYISKDPTHSGKVMYKIDDWPTASDNTGDDTTLTYVYSLFSDAGGGTLHIQAGEYSGTELSSSGVFIINKSASITIKNHGSVTLSNSGSDNDVLSIYNGANVIFEGDGIDTFFISSVQAGRYLGKLIGNAAGQNITFNNIKIQGLRGFYCYNGLQTITLSECWFDKVLSNSVWVNHADTTVIINHSRFTGSAYLRLELGTLKLNNIIHVGSPDKILYVKGSGSPTLEVKNIIGIAGDIWDSSQYILDNISTGSPTITVVNSNLLLHPSDYDHDSTNNIDISDTSNLRTFPGFKRPRRKGMIVLAIDDAIAEDTFTGICDYANPRGIPVTWFASSLSNMDLNARWESAKTYVKAGDELGCHGYTGFMFDGTWEGFAISYSNGGETATVTITDTQLSLNSSLAGGDDDHAFALGDYRMETLCAAINSLSNYTCVIDSDCPTYTPPTKLAEISDVDISSEYICLLDEAKMVHYETYDAKAKLELEMRKDGELSDWVAKTMAYSGWYYTANLENSLHSAGFIGARARSSKQKFSDSPKIFELYGDSVTSVIGQTGLTAAIVKRRVAALCEYLSYFGGIFVFVGHHSDTWGYGTDPTLQYWKWLIDALSDSANNCDVVTFSTAVEWLIANGTQAGTVGSDITYTIADDDNTWETLGFTPDYRLKFQSPCRDAGTIISGITTEYYNTAPDIGAYEYTGGNGGGFFGFGLKLGVGGLRLVKTTMP